jgi:hypothetical protein
MSSNVPPALLGALETVFNKKINTNDARKAVKRPWPSTWAKAPRKLGSAPKTCAMVLGSTLFP